jgi:hypothetical protein
MGSGGQERRKKIDKETCGKRSRADESDQGREQTACRPSRRGPAEARERGASKLGEGKARGRQRTGGQRGLKEIQGIGARTRLNSKRNRLEEDVEDSSLAKHE